MSIDVKKTLQDAGYVTVGVGVLATQQAQVRRRALQDTVGAQVRETTELVKAGTTSAQDTVVTSAKDTRQKLRARTRSVQSAIADSAIDVLNRTQPLVEEVRQRIEPLAAQLQVVPDQLTKVVDTGRERVQQLARRAA